MCFQIQVIFACGIARWFNGEGNKTNAQTKEYAVKRDLVIFCSQHFPYKMILFSLNAIKIFSTIGLNMSNYVGFIV